MSLESFFGLEQGESQGNAEASEKFQEQMRKNAAASKALAAHQQRQKQKEDRLAKILVAFLQDQSKADLVFLVVKLLQENVPGAFILAILSIASGDLEEELKKSFLELEMNNERLLGSIEMETLPATLQLPPTLRQDLNAWGETILRAGLLMPGKTLESVLTPDHKLKSIVLDLIDYSMEEYFERHGLDFSEANIRQFALLSIQSVLIKLRDFSQGKTDAEIIETPLES